MEGDFLLLGILIFIVAYAWRTITKKLNEIDEYVKAIHYRLKEKDENGDNGM